MAVKIYLLCVLILESISGTLCYDYDVGGLVASSLAAFIFLVAIVIMAIVAVLWRDWYMKRQAARGRYRIPREEWRLFKFNTMRRADSQIGTPRSDRRMNMRMYNIAHMPGSKTTTIDRQEPSTDAWVTRLTPSNYYEEKSKTINLEPEEENVIVADVLPDTYMRSTTRTVQPVVITTSQSGLNQANTYQDASRTTYVPLQPKTSLSATRAAEIQPTREHIKYEPYHVHVKMAQGDQQTSRGVTQTTQSARQLSKTMPAGGGREDFFIQPIVPTSNQPYNQTAGVVVFDSDDEAGNIPARTQQSEDLVLF